MPGDELTGTAARLAIDGDALLDGCERAGRVRVERARDDVRDLHEAEPPIE